MEDFAGDFLEDFSGHFFPTKMRRKNPATNQRKTKNRRPKNKNLRQIHSLGCRKWGCNKWGLKGCLATLPGNRPKWPFPPFFCLFRPFPEGAKSTWEIQKTEENGLFPQISSDLLKPPSLKPPFAALQILPKSDPNIWTAFATP